MNMQEKECRQLKVDMPTPCFRRKGRRSCSGDDCLVESRVEELGYDSPGMVELLLHSRCRISSLSQDNAEYLERDDVEGWKEEG